MKPAEMFHNEIESRVSECASPPADDGTARVAEFAPCNLKAPLLSSSEDKNQHLRQIIRATLLMS